jgi:hypothetical protein
MDLSTYSGKPLSLPAKASNDLDAALDWMQREGRNIEQYVNKKAAPMEQFENLLAARQWVGTFVHWYNHEHRHSAVRFVTLGQDAALLAKRVDVYEAAKAKHPQRWSGSTRNWQPVQVVHLNPDQQKSKTSRSKEENIELKKAA